jgi:hypothetical protein
MECAAAKIRASVAALVAWTRNIASGMALRPVTGRPGENAMDTRGNGATAASVVLGVGLGGFIDGIILHQLLQWHHMLSSWRLPTSIENLDANTL